MLHSTGVLGDCELDLVYEMDWNWGWMGLAGRELLDILTSPSGISRESWLLDLELLEFFYSFFCEIFFLWIGWAKVQILLEHV